MISASYWWHFPSLLELGKQQEVKENFLKEGHVHILVVCRILSTLVDFLQTLTFRTTLTFSASMTTRIIKVDTDHKKKILSLRRSLTMYIVFILFHTRQRACLYMCSTSSDGKVNSVPPTHQDHHSLTSVFWRKLIINESTDWHPVLAPDEIITAQSEGACNRQLCLNDTIQEECRRRGVSA